MPQIERVRVQVDSGKCQGHNRCKLAAPALFVLDQYGNAQAAGDGSVPPGQMDRAKLAQANCPEFAVTLRRERAP